MIIGKTHLRVRFFVQTLVYFLAQGHDYFQIFVVTSTTSPQGDPFEFTFAQSCE